MNGTRTLSDEHLEAIRGQLAELDREIAQGTDPGQLTQRIGSLIGTLGQADEGVQRARTDLQNIVFSLPDGLLILDADGRIVRASHLAKELLGSEHDELDGVLLSDRLQGQASDLLAGLPAALPHGYVRALPASVKAFAIDTPLAVSVTALDVLEGRPRGYACVIRRGGAEGDMAVAAPARARVVEAHERLSGALNMARAELETVTRQLEVQQARIGAALIHAGSVSSDASHCEAGIATEGELLAVGHRDDGLTYAERAELELTLETTRSQLLNVRQDTAEKVAAEIAKRDEAMAAKREAELVADRLEAEREGLEARWQAARDELDGKRRNDAQRREALLGELAEAKANASEQALLTAHAVATKDRFEADLAELRAENEALREAAEDVGTEPRETDSEEVSRYQAELAELRAEVESLRDGAASAAVQLETGLSAVTIERDRLATELAEAQAELEAAQKDRYDLAALREDHAEAKAALAAAGAKANNEQHRSAEAVAEAAAVRTDHEGLEGELEAARLRAYEMQQRVDELVAETSRLRQENGELERKSGNDIPVDTDLQALAAELDEIRERLDGREQEIDWLKEDKVEVERSLNEALKELNEGAKAEHGIRAVEKMEREVELSAKREARIRSQMEQIRRRADAKTGEARQLKDGLRQTEEVLRDLQSRFDAAEDQRLASELETRTRFEKLLNIAETTHNADKREIGRLSEMLKTRDGELAEIRMSGGADASDLRVKLNKAHEEIGQYRHKLQALMNLAKNGQLSGAAPMRTTRIGRPEVEAAIPPTQTVAEAEQIANGPVTGKVPHVTPGAPPLPNSADPEELYEKHGS